MAFLQSLRKEKRKQKNKTTKQNLSDTYQTWNLKTHFMKSLVQALISNKANRGGDENYKHTHVYIYICPLGRRMGTNDMQ